MLEQIEEYENKVGSSFPRTVKPVSSPLYRWFRSYVRSLTSAGSADAKSNQMIMIGWIATIGFPLYGWIWSAAYPQPYENFALRFLGMVLALPLLFARRIGRKLWLERYFYAALTYMEPYFFTFMFLMNDGSSVWSQSLLIAVVALFLFDGMFATISWLIGTMLAYFTFVVVTDHAGWPGSNILVNIPIDIFAILLVSVSKVSRRIIEEEKLNGLAIGLSNISHELRTPLLSVNASASGLKRYVPSLVEFYKKHRGLAVGSECVPERQLDMTVPAIERIQGEVQGMNSAIDLLLVNASRTRDKPQMIKLFSVKELIERTIARYPFESDKYRSLVTINIQSDFQVEANQDLMSMVIVNLLKNALRAVARARKGDIRIVVGTNERGGQIIIRDTGCGIPPSQLADIFTRFHSYPAHEGTGIGLAFCRETLAAWGAKIACRSEEGVFCEFVMQFKSHHDPKKGLP